MVIVKAQGIQTWIASSQRRRNNQYHRITVHDLCRKSYNQQKRILAAIKTPENPVRNRNKRITDFNFKNDCLLCGKDASSEYVKNEMRKKPNKRDLVSNVTTLKFKESLLVSAKKQDDAWGARVIQRIINEIDLVAAEGKYHRSCLSNFMTAKDTDKPVGRPESSSTVGAMEFICNFLEENREGCQFSLREIIEQYTKAKFLVKTIKKKLQQKYEDDIITTTNTRQEPIVCFKDTGHKLLTDTFYTSRERDIQKERQRVVREAAEIILQDIRSRAYETKSYPSPHEFLKNVASDVPDTLKILLETVILSHKKSSLNAWSPTTLLQYYTCNYISSLSQIYYFLLTSSAGSSCKQKMWF